MFLKLLIVFFFKFFTVKIILSAIDERNAMTTVIATTIAPIATPGPAYAFAGKAMDKEIIKRNARHEAKLIFFLIGLE